MSLQYHRLVILSLSPSSMIYKEKVGVNIIMNGLLKILFVFAECWEKKVKAHLDCHLHSSISYCNYSATS